jgi:GNAT superfamily N-acetyltransferase
MRRVTSSPVGRDDLARALQMLRAVARQRSTEVLPLPGGEAMVNTHFPEAHDHNKVMVTTRCSARAVAKACDDVYGSRGMSHRLIEVHDVTLGDQLADELSDSGYTGGHELLMAFAETVVPRTSPASIVELDVTERAAVASADWRCDQPGWPESTVDQLGRRIATITDAARTSFLAVRDEDGSVASHADLYLRDGVAQVEEVLTRPAARGRGLASALVLDTVRRARDWGADLVFLIADAEDWPQELYRRLGFVDLGRTVSLRRQS